MCEYGSRYTKSAQEFTRTTSVIHVNVPYIICPSLRVATQSGDDNREGTWGLLIINIYNHIHKAYNFTSELPLLKPSTSRTQELTRE